MGLKTNLKGSDKIQKKWLGCIVIFVATFAVYWPALRGNFIWDDDRYVSENRLLTNLGGLQHIWLRPNSMPQYYPMTHTSFWIEYQLWGLNPLGYHITNILLQALNAVLVWQLLTWLELPGAWLAGMIFALHPVNVETSAWITERKNLLATMFGLLSILSYLRDTRRGYSWSIILFVCALLSKTVAASVPAVLLVLIWWKRGRIERRDILKVLPMLILGAGLGILTILMERNYVGASGPDWDLSFADRVLIAGRAIWFYFGKLLWPTKLTFSYPRWAIDPRDSSQWIFPIAVVIVLVALGLSHKRIGRGPAAAALIYCGTLFPALGFFNTYPMRYSFVADHFQYLSTPAMIAAIVAGLAMLIRGAPLRIASGAVVVVILGAITFQQSQIYADQVTLWNDTLAKNPSSWMARNNLGAYLSGLADADLAKGDPHAAEEKLNRAIQLFEETEHIRPQDDLTWINQADALSKLHRYDEAVAIYRSQSQKNPTDLELHMRIAYRLEDMGHPDLAVEEYEKTLAAYPKAIACRLQLGLLLARMGKIKDAIPELEQYLKANSRDINAIVALGTAYGQLGQFNQAEQQFHNALAIDPFSEKAQTGLAAVDRAIPNASR